MRWFWRIGIACLFIGCLGGESLNTALAHPGFTARIKAISARIVRDPENPANYALRASEYSRHGDWEKADADFKKAEALGGRVAILTEIALHHKRQGFYEKADFYLTERLALMPRDPKALRERAKLYAQRDRVSDALTDYTRYFEVVGDKLRPRDVLSMTSLILKQNPDAFASAITLIDEAQGRIGQVVRLERRAAEIERANGLLSSAIRRWQATKTVAQNSPAWMLHMAELYKEAGNVDKVQTYITQIMARLATLKPTPARRQIKRRAIALQGE